MAGSVSIDCGAKPSCAVRKAAEILRRVLLERCGVKVAPAGRADCRVALSLKAGIGTEGFAISDGQDGAVHIVGSDALGLVHGVGKFLRDCRCGAGSFVPGSWRGTSIPAKPVRGMYFASHFHNFYHDAPVEKVERYVEELALWGCNALSLWFDMHHFTGIDDPAAQAMIRRLRAVLQAAGRVGIRPGLTTLANEAYSTSPQHLRADWTAGHDGYTSPPGGHYHVEICPSKPGGLELIVKLRREMLEAFSDLDIQYVWIWPYDQGGCTCARCAPWGVNGFLRTAKAEAEVIRQCCPSARTILSTWYFDRFTSGEWEGLAKAFEREKPHWANYLMADDFGGFPAYPLQHGVPGGLPVVNFPEISMESMFPWGGFGANPRPSHWQAQWDKTRHLVAGGFPYSEGIYEDINKVIFFQFGWNPQRSAADIVREYAAYEFAPEVAGDVARAVELMEQGLSHGIRGKLPETLYQPQPDIYQLDKTDKARECFELMQAADAGLSARARQSWRWRVLWLRAALDAELRQSAGKATRKTEQYFDELKAIYHADAAEFQVAAPGVESLKRIFAEGIKQT